MQGLQVQDIVNKIPTYIYFNELPDRQQALKYVNYLFQNVPQSQSLDQDKLFREVIAKQLRIVSMKIIEPEILIMIALNKITLNDFASSSDSLVQKVVAENPDKYDLDILYRVLAQIMTKLPIDLKERISGKHKLQIFQLVAKFIKMEPKLCEKFIAFDPSINTPITMELDNNDYSNLNNKYLRELYKLQNTQPYINADSLEFGALSSKLAQSTPTTYPNNNITAQYVDTNPDLMLGNDNTLYYFDSSSGTISEMPINGINNQTPMSISDLKTVLSSKKINKNAIQNTIDSLHMPTQPIPTNTIPPGFINGIQNMYQGLYNGTTQTQAIIATQANLPDHTPIPPAFLTKLYNMKNAKGLNKQDDQYIQGNQYSRGGQYIQYGQNRRNRDYRHDDDDKINVNQSAHNQSIPNQQNTYNNLDNKFNMLNSTYEHNSMPTNSINTPATTHARASTITTHETARTPTARARARSQSYTSFLPPTATMPATTKHSPAHTTLSHFDNEKTSIAMEKIKNTNKDIENIALGFVTIIILVFLLVIFNTFRNNKNSKT